MKRALACLLTAAVLGAAWGPLLDWCNRALSVATALAH